jgi:hypothetical protein
MKPSCAGGSKGNARERVEDSDDRAPFKEVIEVKFHH